MEENEEQIIHPSPSICSGWELVGGRFCPIRHTRPALPTHLPATGPAEESGEDDSEKEEDGDDDVQRRRGDSFESDNSKSSDAECSDSD